MPNNSSPISAADTPGGFDLLTPHVIISAVEAGFGLQLDGSLTPYNSYINRVYEVKDSDGQPWMVKFYRPNRWSESAILEEHRFIDDCLTLEIPTVAPCKDQDGDTLLHVAVDGQDRGQIDYSFAVFPKKAGRSFDAENDDDWLRLGSLAARLHLAGQKATAASRPVCLPEQVSADCLHALRQNNCVHPDHSQEFFDLTEQVLRTIEPLFTSIPLQRIHGDFHRGNILDRADEGLLLIDFDDMMTGPAVQDIWLLLPDRIDNCPREFNLIAEGYEQFLPFDWSWRRLVEPLRAMRMIYYLAWQARQLHDQRFRRDYPDWGSGAFWSKEIEDLREQAQFL